MRRELGGWLLGLLYAAAVVAVTRAVARSLRAREMRKAVDEMHKAIDKEIEEELIDFAGWLGAEMVRNPDGAEGPDSDTLNP